MDENNSADSNETKTYRFEGYSDDTFGEYAVTLDDYDNCASGEPIKFELAHDGAALIIVGQYCPESCGGWLIGVACFDEDNVPDWPVWLSTKGECPYSPALYIKAPDGAVLTCLNRDEGES